MIVGSSEDNMASSQTNLTQPLPIFIHPIQTKLSSEDLKKNCLQTNIINASLGNSGIKKTFMRKLKCLKNWKNEFKKNVNVNYDVTAAATIVNMDTIMHFFKHSVGASYSQPTLFEPYANIKMPSSLEKHFEANISDEKDFSKVVPEENEGKSYNCSTTGLSLFFESLLQATSEFTEHELLEFEIQVLKTVKSIKEKRGFKQSFRKYCTGFTKDCSLFCGDFQTSPLNIKNILL